jgi:hypothetical protein
VDEVEASVYQTGSHLDEVDDLDLRRFLSEVEVESRSLSVVEELASW